MDATIRIDLSDILNRTRFSYLFSWRQMATGTDGISSVSKLFPNFPGYTFTKIAFNEECARLKVKIKLPPPNYRIPSYMIGFAHS